MGLISDFIASIEAKRGQAATLVVPAVAAMNAFGESAEGSPTLHPVTAVVSTYSTEAVTLSGSIIAATDMRVFLFSSPLVPTTLHRLDIGGASHRIKSVRRRTKGAVTIAYELQVARG